MDMISILPTINHSTSAHLQLVIFTIVYLSYLPSPPLGQDMTQGQFLSGV